MRALAIKDKYSDRLVRMSGRNEILALPGVVTSSSGSLLRTAAADAAAEDVATDLKEKNIFISESS